MTRHALLVAARDPHTTAAGPHLQARDNLVQVVDCRGQSRGQEAASVLVMCTDSHHGNPILQLGMACNAWACSTRQPANNCLLECSNSQPMTKEKTENA